MYKYLTFAFLAMLVMAVSGCQMGTGPGLFFSMPSDATLTTRVQQALYSSDDPIIANVRAQGLEGTIVLTGYVKKIRQSDEAESIARNVPGVRSVENHIIVRQ